MPDPPQPVTAGMPPAEQEVDEARARLLLGAYPSLVGRPVRLLGVGWDNTVWLVDETWTVRFPRRRSALELQEREVAVLRLLTGRLPLPIPSPQLMAPPYADYPWPSWAARVVPGTELADARPSDGERVDLAEDVGGFLAALHRPALAEEARVSVPGLSVDPGRRADMATRVPWAEQTVRRAVDLGLLPVTPAGFADLAGEALDLPPSSAEPVLCHGDLHLRHVLVTGRRAGGVIDWGDTCLGDAAVDLSFAFAALTGTARERCLTAYERGGGRPLDRAGEVRARLLGAGLCAMLAVTGHDTGADALCVEASRGVERAVS